MCWELRRSEKSSWVGAREESTVSENPQFDAQNHCRMRRLGAPTPFSQRCARMLARQARTRSPNSSLPREVPEDRAPQGRAVIQAKVGCEQPTTATLPTEKRLRDSGGLARRGAQKQHPGGVPTTLCGNQPISRRQNSPVSRSTTAGHPE